MAWSSCPVFISCCRDKTARQCQLSGEGLPLSSQLHLTHQSSKVVRGEGPHRHQGQRPWMLVCRAQPPRTHKQTPAPPASASVFPHKLCCQDDPPQTCRRQPILDNSLLILPSRILICLCPLSRANPYLICVPAKGSHKYLLPIPHQEYLMLLLFPYTVSKHSLPYWWSILN